MMRQNLPVQGMTCLIAGVGVETDVEVLVFYLMFPYPAKVSFLSFPPEYFSNFRKLPTPG